MNILRLTPARQEKSGITYYSIVFDKVLRQQGIDIRKARYLFANRSTWWLPFDFLLRRKYWENLLEDIDLIHAEIGMHQAKEILTLLFLARFKKALKVFVTIHDPGVERYRIFKIYYNTSGSLFSKFLNKIADKIEPFVDRLFFNGAVTNILRESCAVIVLNQWGAEQLWAKYPAIKEKTHIINHPVYDFPKQEIKPIEERNLVFAGFWSENKGIETLIKAYYLLRKKEEVLLRLILAGETQIPNSSYTRQIKKLIKNLELTDFVDLPGFFEKDKMFEVLSRSILIIPYTKKISGAASGIRIMGLQAGAVTIVADNPTLSTFAKGNDISLIFKQESADDLSKKIREVIQNKDLAYHLAKNGQDFVYKYGDWERLGKSIINVYKLHCSF